MFQFGLRVKVLLGALFLVLIVSTSITIVVSTLVTRQNKRTVNTSLDKAMVIVRDSITVDQKAFMDAIQQMGTVNKLGENVQFLTGFQDAKISLVSSSYEKMVKIITNTGLVNDIFAIRIYNQDKQLLGYYQKKEDGKLLSGFSFQNTFYSRTYTSQQDYTAAKFKETTDLNSTSSFLHRGHSQTLARELPMEKNVSIEIIEGLHGFETRVPLFANVYNDKTQQAEPQQVGFMIAISRLNKAFLANMKRITGMGMNLFIKDEYSSGDYPAYAKVDLSKVPKTPGNYRKDNAYYFSEIIFKNQNFFQVLMPFYSQGKRSGGVLLVESDVRLKANTRQMIVMISLVSLACILLVVPLAWFVAGKMINPLIHLKDKLNDIAEGEGDLTTRLDVRSNDETGQLAQCFNTFIHKIHSLIKEVAENSYELNQASASLAQISKGMAEGAGQTAAQSNSVSAASEQMSVSMTSVARSMDQAAENMVMVSTATEEMTCTINEISKNTQGARQITSQVMEKTKLASDQVLELGSAAHEIGVVVESITDISNQVNLLALNATIEAARAGEAGKGFAVVANEIKELANQTAHASSEIKEKVTNIRTSTDLTVTQIKEVSNVVNKVNDIVLIIASAVEEQSVTTRDISERITQVTQGIDGINNNVAQSSSGSDEIAEQITGVTKNADQMTQNGKLVDTRSRELALLSDKLTALVKRFKIND